MLKVCFYSINHRPILIRKYLGHTGLHPAVLQLAAQVVVLGEVPGVGQPRQVLRLEAVELVGDRRPIVTGDRLPITAGSAALQGQLHRHAAKLRLEGRGVPHLGGGGRGGAVEHVVQGAAVVQVGVVLGASIHILHNAVPVLIFFDEVAAHITIRVDLAEHLGVISAQAVLLHHIDIPVPLGVVFGEGGGVL